MSNKTMLYTILAIITAGAVGVAVWVYTNASDEQAVPQNNQESTQISESTEQGSETEGAEGEIRYDGVEGETALALLQKNYEVEMNGEGQMAFVTSIDGVKAGESQFWAFYINGESAPVGAGTYVTKDGDVITWELEDF